jgi:transcriptional regulator with XRE-family HTH domain
MEDVVNSTVVSQQPQAYNVGVMVDSGSRLSKLLTRLRERSGLSLRDVEEQTGLSRANLSRLEHGTYAKPAPETLRRLAQVYGVDASELLTAAGYTAKQAEALPSLRPYLRAKYGHLSADARREVQAFIEQLEAEQTEAREKKTRTKK